MLRLLSSTPLRAGLVAGASAGFAIAFSPEFPLPSFRPFTTATMDTTPAPALSPTEWRGLKLAQKTALTPNTYHLRFALLPGQAAGLTVASCLLVKGIAGTKEDGSPELAIRPYTPTSKATATGHLDLIVKAYEQGKCSKYLGNLKVGDVVEMKGPIVKFKYEANTYEHVGMVAGGSGITPMLQVADAMLDNPEDRTKISLVFANETEADIIMKKEIDALAGKYPGRFSVHYVVTKPDMMGLMWKGSTGFITPEILKKHMPGPQKGNVVMVCGPPGMMNFVSGNKVSPQDQGEVSGVLKDLGYAKEHVYKF